MLDPQWVLNRLDRGELILRVRIEKGIRFDYFPYHLHATLMSFTGSGRSEQAFGKIWVEVGQTRLEHFHIDAKRSRAEAEQELEERIRRWSRPWDFEQDVVVEIGRSNMRHPEDTVPLSNLLVIQHLTLLQGLFYQAARKHRTKAENALIRDISYKLNSVVARANEGLHLGWY